MEREIIERLAMDHALGELDADTAALFEAYLSEHDEVRAWAQAMSQTCTRTRAAISRKAQPIEVQRPAPGRRTPWHGAIAGPVLGRWAATILFALGAGIVAGRWSRPQPPRPETVVVRAESPAPRTGWRQIISDTGQGFWETKAVAMLRPKTNEISSTHPGRRSPWDRYRQHRKERSNE